MHAIALDDNAAPPLAVQAHAIRAPLPRFFEELHAQDWPVLLLESRLPEILIHAGSLEPADRCSWLVGLHTAWWRHGWALARSGKEALLELAAAWCAWPLAHNVGHTLEREATLEGEHALRMIDACHHLGDDTGALMLTTRLQLLHPDNPLPADVHRDLLVWQRWRNRMPVIDGMQWDDDALVLEPLAHHHLPDFAWQYYDPAIAQLCCLPDFHDREQWHAWLEDAYSGDRRVFAVLHRQWGFIGGVGLVIHHGVGFFYYWMGRDFQGQGFGPRAVSLLLNTARRDYGMRCCYAKVFDYNVPSRRALEKLGFEELGISGAAPDDDQLFYRWGEARPIAETAEELHGLLASMHSDVRAALPFLPAGFRKDEQ